MNDHNTFFYEKIRIIIPKLFLLPLLIWSTSSAEEAKIAVYYRISSVIRRCFFSYQNNPKDLDLSCKTDLDLWDCFGRVKLVLQQHFIGLI